MSSNYHWQTTYCSTSQQCTGCVREVLKLAGLESVKDVKSFASRQASCSYYYNTLLLYTCYHLKFHVLSESLCRHFNLLETGLKLN